MFKIFTIVGFILIVFGTIQLVQEKNTEVKKNTVEAVNINEILQENKENKEKKEYITENQTKEEFEKNIGEETPAKLEPLSLPKELNLDLAFYPQAPFADWDYPWQEACEEASVLLVANAYYQHNWTREEFNQEILQLVDWQNETFGDYWHTTMEQTAQMLKSALNLESVTHKNPSFKDIKSILAKGHLIILPFDGQQVENPFFSGDGPIYHVIVVKGYTANNELITHDVGTKRGADYIYSWEMLGNALHDYAEPMTDGDRVILEVLPPESLN